ncbi:type II secretion system protein GspD [Synergistales bacterium]|nr:type II secretion system protein GspD [Synergistales bacterium]
MKRVVNLQKNSNNIDILCVVILCVFILSALLLPAYPSFAAPAPVPEAAQEAKPEDDEKTLIEAAQAMRRAGVVQFNFKDIDLVKFVRFMSELLQENIIVPPNAAGKVTIISPKPSSLHDAKQIFLSILQTSGFSIQNMGSYSKLVQGAPSASPYVSMGHVGPGYGEEIVTYIAPLDYVAADYMIQALQQVFGQSVMVIPVGTGRSILMQGRSTDVNKAVDLVRKLDVPSSARTSRTFQINFADAGVMAGQLNAVAQTGGTLRGLVAIPDPNSRQVVVVAEPRVIEEARRIIAELDVDSKTGDFHIYKLKNVDATAAAEQIGKVLAASAMLQPAQDGKFPATVVPDVTTNSLIFASTQRQYDALEKILDEIDIQPKQVLIRGFLAEINVSNLDKAGIDWAVLGGQMLGDTLLGGAVQLGEVGVPDQFQQWFTELSRKEERIPATATEGSYTVTNFSPMPLAYMTIDMLKKYDAVNVLSMPRLMCTDNKESSFQVGQVVPVMKGSTSDISNPNSIQNNFDYKDTGLTLTVTPHIRSGNVIALDIDQTTEDLMTAIGNVTPVTAKRQVKTSVVVADGETIVLSGIVKETERSLKRRVPGLSFIPLIGGLFQKVSKEKEKIDFIIFLTPQIIQNNDQMRAATKQAVMTSGDIGLGLDTGDMSPVEIEINNRFRELYRKSIKTQ